MAVEIASVWLLVRVTAQRHLQEIHNDHLMLSED
jgi:hypothetical protein